MNKLSNKTILYRAITKKRWIDPDTEEIDAEAFILRLNESGLSAALKPEHTYNRLNRCYGVISFTVGDLRELGLDAIQDKVDHVNIINVPNPETNEKEALDIAVKLARKARLHIDWLVNPYKRK